MAFTPPYRKYPAIQQPMSIDLLDDGIAFTAATGQGNLTWPTIVKWRQNERVVLVYLSPRLYHLVPKRLAQDGFDVNTMTDALDRSVGPAT